MTQPTPEDASWPELHRVRRAIVVVDVVESVRLMQANEADTIARWRRFVHEVRTDVLPKFGGRMVKSLGDGMLLEFDAVAGAARAALLLPELMAAIGKSEDEATVARLRVGAHVTTFVRVEDDIQGSGVNLACRLAALAGPGECVASAEFRDELTDSLDAEIHDLGDCFLKHFDAPVRAFRLGQANTAAPASTTAVDPAGVAVAVLPFAVLASDKRAHFAGDALADDVIAGLSREPRLRVLSPLSTRPFGHLPDATAGGAEQDVLERLRLHLHVSYVVTGRCAVAGDALKLQAQLIDARSGAILWADSARSTVDAVLMDAGGLVDEVVAAIGHHILDNELRRARSLPFQSLDNYSLYWSGVTLLNRLSRSDFDRSRGAFDQLAERQPRNAAPLAMSARWHVLRMMQGWAPSFNDEAEHARALARRALAIDRDNALGLAVDGLVSAHVDGDLDVALARCRSAVAADAQDPYAWMMLSGVLSYLGRGEEAVPAAEHAIALSPLDPALFQYEAYLAMALLSAHRFEEAAESAAASHRRNATLTGSLRIRIIALDGAARFDEARRLAAHMLHLQPGYTVAQYLRRYPGRHSQHAESYAEALRRAGIPP